MLLENRVAVVTGGSRGIGFAIAAALLQEGARVVVAARHERDLAKARDQLVRLAAGGADRVDTHRTDVRNHEDVDALMRATVDRFGGFDILVNNAGLGIQVDVADMSIDQWRETIDTNLSGVFFCCHAAIPHLRQRGGGWIINISSLAGKNAIPGMAAYCASKAGLNAFSETLMQEVRYDGIRVSYIMPGSVDTEFGGHETGAISDWKLHAEDIARVVLDLVSHPPRSLPSRVEMRPSKPRKR